MCKYQGGSLIELLHHVARESIDVPDRGCFRSLFLLVSLLDFFKVFNQPVYKPASVRDWHCSNLVPGNVEVLNQSVVLFENVLDVVNPEAKKRTPPLGVRSLMM